MAPIFSSTPAIPLFWFAVTTVVVCCNNGCGFWHLLSICPAVLGKGGFACGMELVRHPSEGVILLTVGDRYCLGSGTWVCSFITEPYKTISL